MAYTFQGIGTTFYGQRDFRPDGSYVTTEWFTVLYIPIVPLFSLRVIYTGSLPVTIFIPGVISSKEGYRVFERKNPNWKQVAYTYGFLALIAGWARLVPYAYNLGAKNHEELTLYLIIFSFLLPISVPFIMRHFARKSN